MGIGGSKRLGMGCGVKGEVVRALEVVEVWKWVVGDKGEVVRV